MDPLTCPPLSPRPDLVSDKKPLKGRAVSPVSFFYQTVSSKHNTLHDKAIIY